MTIANVSQKFNKLSSLIETNWLKFAFFIFTILFSQTSPLLASDSPQFIFEAPESLAPLASHLESTNPDSLQRIMGLVGLEHPGPAIRVILAPNDSQPARDAPAWMSGYALSQTSTIVLLTDRVLTYPNDSLNDVFLHEIGHILAHRAAGGNSLPRWFDEGLAMMTVRSWDFEDRARLVWAMVSGKEISLDELNALFVQNDASVRRAYVLTHAFTLDLLEHTQQDVHKKILAKVKEGLSFSEAFAHVTVMTLSQAEENFWSRQTLWDRWIPVATSSGMVWVTITFLAFWVWRKQRQRNAAIKQQWREDDWDV